MFGPVQVGAGDLLGAGGEDVEVDAGAGFGLGEGLDEGEEAEEAEVLGGAGLSDAGGGGAVEGPGVDDALGDAGVGDEPVVVVALPRPDGDGAGRVSGAGGWCAGGGVVVAGHDAHHVGAGRAQGVGQRFGGGAGEQQAARPRQPGREAGGGARRDAGGLLTPGGDGEPLGQRQRSGAGRAGVDQFRVRTVSTQWRVRSYG